MEIQLNLDQHQAIKNLTQAGIDEEQATALVSTFGGFSEKIATKDDLAVVKQEMKAMETRQSQEMKAMDDKQSQRSDYLEKTLTQEMKSMDTKQAQRSEYLEKNLTKEISKSRYVMFAAGATGALIMLGLYEAWGRFLN